MYIDDVLLLFKYLFVLLRVSGRKKICHVSRMQQAVGDIQTDQLQAEASLQLQFTYVSLCILKGRNIQ